MQFTPDPGKRQKHEYWLTWAITIIVGLELLIALFGIWEGKEQLRTLKDQVHDLTMLNASLQASIHETRAMTDVLGKQLSILQEQEQSRLAALQRRPKLVILGGGADLMNRAQTPSPCHPLEGRGDIAGCLISIENRGDLPFTHGRLRAWETTGAAFLAANFPATGHWFTTGLPGNEIELTLPTLFKGEPTRYIQIEVALSKKKRVQLNLQIVGDGIGTINLTPMTAIPTNEVAPQ